MLDRYGAGYIDVTVKIDTSPRATYINLFVLKGDIPELERHIIRNAHCKAAVLYEAMCVGLHVNSFVWGTTLLLNSQEKEETIGSIEYNWRSDVTGHIHVDKSVRDPKTWHVVTSSTLCESEGK